MGTILCEKQLVKACINGPMIARGMCKPCYHSWWLKRHPEALQKRLAKIKEFKEKLKEDPDRLQDMKKRWKKNQIAGPGGKHYLMRRNFSKRVRRFLKTGNKKGIVIRIGDQLVQTNIKPQEADKVHVSIFKRIYTETT